MERSKQGVWSKGRGPFLRFLLWITLPLFLVPPILTHTFKNPAPDDSQSLLRAAMATHNYSQAEQAARHLLNTDPNDPARHLMYLGVYFEVPQSRRDDTALLNRYQQMAESSAPNLSDIGHWGLGTFYLEKNNGAWALKHLTQIRQPDIRNLHTQLGRALMLTGDVQKSEQAFTDEILSPNGDTASAVRYLARLYDDADNYAKLDLLFHDPQLKRFIPVSLVRHLAIKNGYYFAYIRSLFSGLSMSFNWIGGTGALLILIVWTAFLRRVDVFEPEKWRFMILTLLMGMAASFLCLPLYDAAEVFFHFTLNGRVVNDLLFSVFGIGLFEELVKMLPVIIMVVFTRQVDESIDLVIYACLSALGFSFVENIGYFDEYSLSIMKARGMICSTGHMVYSSLVVYGYILARYKKQGSVVGNTVLFFLLAIFVHGLYDYFLICDGLNPEFKGLSFLIILAKTILFVLILNNALNQSEFFDEHKAAKFTRMRELLGISLVGIVLFEYTALSYKFGPELTNLQFLPVIGLTWCMVFFFAGTLGNYQLRRGYWLPLYHKGRREKSSKGGPGEQPKPTE